jgi:hypothetical protein
MPARHAKRGPLRVCLAGGLITRAARLSFAVQLLVLFVRRETPPRLSSAPAPAPAAPRAPRAGNLSANATSIFAAFMTDQGSTRAADLLAYLAQSRVPPGLAFNAWLINWTTFNDTARRLLYPPDYYREAMRLNRRVRRFRKDLDLSAKFFFALRFFLENTTDPWFYRATDDTIVNFENLGPFMADLQARRNPLDESVVVGNCIDLKRFSYLQGGVGILFSRVAAARISQNLESFVSSLNKPEDVYFTNLLNRTGVTLYEATSEFFIGHDIYSDHRYMFWNNTLDKLLPPCPKVNEIWAKSCRRFVSPLADLVFWHQEGKNKTLGQTIMFSKWVMRQPRWMNWWLNKGRPWLCRAENVNQRLY